MRPGRASSLTSEEIRRRTRGLFLGLLVVGAALGLLFGGLAAYAGMWPPALVVESGSMQHSDTASDLGVLDTGDLAVIQAIRDPGDVVTYLAGRATGHTSFGDYGDVIAFADPEPNETAVLLHRAFARVARNASGGFDVPELAAIPRSEWWGIASDGTNASAPYRLRSFDVAGMGWRHDLTIEWNLTALGTSYPNDGFLTFGDHNLYRASNRTDPWILTPLYVIARAQGEIPWVGLLRLTLVRSPEGCCEGWGSTNPDVGAPANSWWALDLLLIAAFATPVAMDLLWHRFSLRRLHRSGKEGVTVAGAPNPAIANPRGLDGAMTPEATPAAPIPREEFDAWLQAVDARIQRIRSSFGIR